MPTEADTCRTYIVPQLHAAGWEDDFIAEQRVIVPLGRKHMRQESRRPDYILFLRRNYPIAVVEAKAEYRQRVDGAWQSIDALKQLQTQTHFTADALLPNVFLSVGH